MAAPGLAILQGHQLRGTTMDVQVRCDEENLDGTGGSEYALFVGAGDKFQALCGDLHSSSLSHTLAKVLVKELYPLCHLKNLAFFSGFSPPNREFGKGWDTLCD